MSAPAQQDYDMNSHQGSNDALALAGHCHFNMRQQLQELGDLLALAGSAGYF